VCGQHFGHLATLLITAWITLAKKIRQWESLCRLWNMASPVKFTYKVRAIPTFKKYRGTCSIGHPMLQQEGYSTERQRVMPTRLNPQWSDNFFNLLLIMCNGNCCHHELIKKEFDLVFFFFLTFHVKHQVWSRSHRSPIRIADWLRLHQNNYVQC
jgi:hypothetical protein